LGGGWVYTAPAVQRLPLASLIQQRGRIGRRKQGVWYTFSDQTEEIKITADRASQMVRGCLSGDMTGLAKTYPSVADANLIRAAIAFSNKFGNYPEEILIGITKGAPNYPKFGDKMPIGADKNLWARYLKEVEPDAPQLNVSRAKEIIFLMIKTYLGNQKSMPEKVNVVAVNELIERTKLTEAEVKKVVNTKIQEELKKVEPHYQTVKKYTDEDKFKKVVVWHQLNLGAEIKIDGKKLTLQYQQE
jgi:hypothetical protein